VFQVNHSLWNKNAAIFQEHRLKIDNLLKNAKDERDLLERELELTEKVLNAKTLPITLNYKAENISSIS
jgi:hypothetical protein